MSKIKEDFLEMLDEPEIQEKIRKIASDGKKKFSVLQGDDSKWKTKCKELEAQLEDEQREKRTLARGMKELDATVGQLREEKERITGHANERIREAEQSASQLEEKLQRAKQSAALAEEKFRKAEQAAAQGEERVRQAELAVKMAEKESEYFQSQYGKIDFYYKMYGKMSGRIHEALSRVLTTESAELFLCWGSQWINIEQLWEFMSYNLENPEYQAEEIEGLKEIFDYLFETYRTINSNYERLNAEVGDEFDEDIHTRARNSRVAGTISQVLLLGYRRISDGKTKKSIVRV